MKTLLLFVSLHFLPFCIGRPQHGLEPQRSIEYFHLDPDMFRNVSELISSKDYPVENHDVQTEDGYILTIQRIPNGKGNWNYQGNAAKEVIFLQHGLLSSAADWVMNFPNQSLGFLLADAGYDVWLGNIRGNTYGRRHVKYDTDSKEFWNFSIDEHALRDLPAMIDFILETTGQEKLYYVGHSQGTLTAFALLSEKEEYNDKLSMSEEEIESQDCPCTPHIAALEGSIYSAPQYAVVFEKKLFVRTNNFTTALALLFAVYYVFSVQYPSSVSCTLEFIQRCFAGINPPRGTKSSRTNTKEYHCHPKVLKLSNELRDYENIKVMIALAPVATVGYINSPIHYLAPFSGDIEFLTRLLGVKELLPSDTIMKYVSELVCGTDLKFVCKNILFLLCGTDTSQLNETRLHVYSAHSPAGTSTKNIFHYAQMVNSKTFQKFDYGKHHNPEHYNQTTPPEYKVENIKAPVALFWSRNDLLADPADVGLLEMKLKNLVESYLVELPVFSHIDFVYGINARYFLYEEVFSVLNKFSW